MIPNQFRHGLLAVLSLLAISQVFDWGDYYWELFAYVAVFVVHHALTFRGPQSRPRYLFGILYPVVVLVLLKYLPNAAYQSLGLELTSDSAPTAIGFIGISYMAFRTSYMTVEVYNTGMTAPRLDQYFSYIFFLPTFSIGPISRYQTYMSSFEDTGINNWRPFPHSFERLLKGLAKYFLLAPIFAQLDYNGLLLDGNEHHPIDLVVASIAFYGYIYCNFSGFVDVVIGVAGILRVRVDENFNQPYLARNVQDFWNRWHMTLNAYMRDMVFTNLSKSLVRRLGPARVNWAVTFSILAVFLLIGLWHGRAWNFVAFGALHGLAVVATHWYGVFLKQVLTRQQLRQYMESEVVRWVSIVTTFAYLCATFALFANDLETLMRIVENLTWS